MRKGVTRLVGVILAGFIIVVIGSGCGGDSYEPPSGAEIERRIDREVAERVHERLAEQRREERIAERQVRESREARERRQIRQERARLITELNDEFTAWRGVAFTGICENERQSVLEEIESEVRNMKEEIRGGDRETINNARTDLERFRSARDDGPLGIYRREAICSPIVILEYAW